MNLFQRPSTVAHGSDQAGLFDNRPKSPNNGHPYFADDLQRLLVFNSRLQTWVPADGQNLTNGATAKYMVDRFRGPVLDSGFVSDDGSDAEAIAPVILTTASGGAVVGVTGNDGGGFAADGAFLSYPLGFAAEDGRSVHHYRFKIDDITTVAFYVGLTDLATFEEPFSLATTTYTSNCSDGCGFLFDTAATDDTIRCVGVAGDTDATHVDSELEPVNDTFLDLSIDLSTAGVAKMYIDEALIATLTGAVDVDVDLHAVICATARTTASRTWTAELQANHQIGVRA